MMTSQEIARDAIKGEHQLTAPISADEVKEGDLVYLIRKSCYSDVSRVFELCVRGIENGIVTDGQYTTFQYEPPSVFADHAIDEFSDFTQIGFVHADHFLSDLGKLQARMVRIGTEMTG